MSAEVVSSWEERNNVQVSADEMMYSTMSSEGGRSMMVSADEVENDQVFCRRLRKDTVSEDEMMYSTMSAEGRMSTMVSADAVVKYQVLGRRLVNDMVSDDVQDRRKEIEDDWIGMDKEELLLITEGMMDGYGHPQTGPEVDGERERMVTTDTSLDHHPTKMIVGPELENR